MINSSASRLFVFTVSGLMALASMALIAAPVIADDAKPEVKKDEWPCDHRHNELVQGRRDPQALAVRNFPAR
jgi:hypothetical protein